jgi:hypothetical protein
MTDERIKELASKWASKYTHRSAPLESVFSFMDRNLVDFGKAITDEAFKEYAEKIAELERQNGILRDLHTNGNTMIAELERQLSDARISAVGASIDAAIAAKEPS